MGRQCQWCTLHSQPGWGAQSVPDLSWALGPCTAVALGKVWRIPLPQPAPPPMVLGWAGSGPSPTPVPTIQSPPTRCCSHRGMAGPPPHGPEPCGCMGSSAGWWGDEEFSKTFPDLLQCRVLGLGTGQGHSVPPRPSWECRAHCWHLLPLAAYEPHFPPSLFCLRWTSVPPPRTKPRDLHVAEHGWACFRHCLQAAASYLTHDGAVGWGTCLTANEGWCSHLAVLGCSW